MNAAGRCRLDRAARLRIATVVFAAIAGWTLNLYGQSGGSSPLEDRWASLQQTWNESEVAEFVASVEATVAERSAWPAELASAAQTFVAEESASRMQALDVPSGAEAADRLVAWASEVLSIAERATVAERLVNELPLESDLLHLQAAYHTHQSLNGPLASRLKVVRDWITTRGVTALEAPELSWAVQALAAAPGAVNQGMRVQWTGNVQAPRSGSYTFSPSATQVRLDYDHLTSKSTTKIWVDGVLVVDTSQSVPVSQVVELEENRPTPIRIEFIYEHSGDTTAGEHPPTAMLFWSGPGVDEQLVPAAALSPPEGAGEGPGLLGEYQALQGPDAEGNPQEPLSNSRIDRQIDFVWTTGRTFLLDDRQLLQELAEAWTSLVSSETHLDEARQQLVAGQWFEWADWLRLSELMTSEQRQRWIEAMIAHDGLLEAMELGHLLAAFHAARPGAEEAAIDLVGRWMEVHSDDPPQPAINYWAANRRIYYWLADHLTYEYTRGSGQLEDGYLEREDKGCVSGVAYIVAYSHAFENRQDEWIEKLEARIADESVTGDAKASWLVARAQAEEIRDSRSPGRLELLPERYHAGLKYLDNASAFANSEAMRLRIFHEKLSRQLPALRFALAREQLQAATAEYGAEGQARIAEMQRAVDQEEQNYGFWRDFQHVNSQQRHVNELQRRLQLAQEAGNEEAVLRYQKLIDTSTNGATEGD